MPPETLRNPNTPFINYLQLEHVLILLLPTEHSQVLHIVYVYYHFSRPSSPVSSLFFLSSSSLLHFSLIPQFHLPLLPTLYIFPPSLPF